MDDQELELLDNFQKKIPKEAPKFRLIISSEYRATNSPSSFTKTTTTTAATAATTTSRSPFLEEVFPCECRFSENATDPESQACGERSNCINRSLSIECNPEDCICRDNCRNQRFQKHQYANVIVFEAPGKGFGLRALEDLNAGSFIMEYVGEVLSQRQFEEQSKLYMEHGQRHFYFMTLQNDQVIDATEKGNLSRFMNHSCNPNCATQKWIVQGRLRIGLFTVKKIKAGTELTFDYKFIRFGATAQKCLCGEANCKGVIGEKWKGGGGGSSMTKSAVKATLQEEIDSEYALERFTGQTGLEDDDDLTLLARVLLRSEDAESILPLLKTLNQTENVNLLKKFVTLHGIQIIGVLFSLHWRDPLVLGESLAVLEKLPIPNKSFIEDAQLEEKFGHLIAREDLSNDFKLRCKDLIKSWETLNRVFRIPRAITTTTPSSTQAIESTKGTTLAGYSLSGNEKAFKKSSWNVLEKKTSSDDPSASYRYKDYENRERSRGDDERKRPRSDYLRDSRSDNPRDSRDSRDSRADVHRQRDYYRNHEPHRSRSRSPRKESNQTLPEGWKVALAQDGRPYYYHETTRETRWDMPEQRTILPTKDEKQTIQTNNDKDVKLQEIIERAKKAALARTTVLESSRKECQQQSSDDILKVKSPPLNDPRKSSSKKVTPPLASTTTITASTTATINTASVIDSTWMKLEASFREAVSQVVVKYLSRWCKDQVDSSSKFKDLARKLTYSIVDKEFRQLKEYKAKEQPSVEAIREFDTKELSKNKKTKVKVFLIQYLQNHGYRVPEDISR